MACHGNERVFGSLLIKRNVLLLQFWSSVLVDTGLQCPLSRMVAHVVKKFLTSVRVLSTICFQILVHMDPIYSILKWKQRVPPELPYHTTALHGVQTQKPTMWSIPFRSSQCWGVMQRRLIVPNVSEQPIGLMFKNQASREISCIFLHTNFHYHSYECVLLDTEMQDECIPRFRRCFWDHFSYHLPMYAIIPQMEPFLQVFQQKVHAHFLSPMLLSVSVFGLYLLYAGIDSAVAFVL